MKITRLTIREYTESLAVAFILAMVIRHFVVEAFRIPTSSMVPTLRGDPGGDRILVSKFQYDLHPPQRWDVIVFKINDRRINYWRKVYNREAAPPGNDALPNGIVTHPGSEEYVNYVKRLVGLPGERIRIRNGDIFINGKIARKPERVQNAMLIPVTNDRLLKARQGELSKRWTTQSSESVTFEPTTLALHGAASPGDCLVSYLYPIRDREGDDGLYDVGDLKLAFRFRHSGPPGYLLGQIEEDGQTHAFRIPLGKVGEPARLWYAGTPVGSAPVNLDLKTEHLVEFWNIDDRVVLKLDGQQVLAWEDNSGDDGPGVERRQRSGVSFGVSGCDVTVRDIALWRDIYYTTHPGQQQFAVSADLVLGDDEHFVLGDNSPNSFDGRNWGVVKRPALIGEAFFVFWPVTRWKFIN